MATTKAKFVNQRHDKFEKPEEDIQLIPASKSTNIKILTVADRRQTALSLRLRGWGYRQIGQAIADKYGDDNLPKDYRVDPRTVALDISYAMTEARELTREAATEMVEIEVARLDEMTQTVMPMALSGNLKAVNAMLRIMERRAKYLGLDTAEQIQVNDWRMEIVKLYREGRVTEAQIKAELGDSMSKEVFTLIENNNNVFVLPRPDVPEIPEELRHETIDAEFTNTLTQIETRIEGDE